MERDEGVLEWARNHNCQFGLPKFQLVDYSRKWEPDPEVPGRTKRIEGPGVRLGETTIKPVPFTKFLGALIDQQLRWNEQHTTMIKKGQQWISQFRCIAGLKTGMTAQLIRQLYKAKAIPRILYAADVTLMPTSRKREKLWKQASAK
ncbi:hypothetical protein GGU11DRAFT_693889 [Lentinula aff. detonsa]|nr:hypothetical protein GGU11DRAFT_693889 [Lentinula aff. detonsa]